MGKPFGPVALGWLGRMTDIAVNEAQEAAFRRAKGHHHAAIGRVVGSWTANQTCALGNGLGGDGLHIAGRCHAKRDCAEFRPLTRIERDDVMVAAGGAQVDHSGRPRDERQAPDVAIEFYGAVEVRRAEIDAAQRCHRKPGHERTPPSRTVRADQTWLFLIAAATSRPTPPFYYTKSISQYKFIDFLES